MKDIIKLFKISDPVKELTNTSVNLEKDLQHVIEKNMLQFFGVRFLASEYVTTNGGRMDSIGIDENNCPVIFEYKRDVSENVINQGLFYLDWLIQHKDSFHLLLLKSNISDKEKIEIDWSMPRVICIANDFTKYDKSAINQMNKNIVLIKYKKFDNDLLLFEQINENIVSPFTSCDSNCDTSEETKTKNSTCITCMERKTQLPKEMLDLYDQIRSYILGLGDDISENLLKYYIAFKKIKNIVCIELYDTKFIVHLKLDTSTVVYETNFSRDTSNIGHWGTGDVEITIKNEADFIKAKDLIKRAYDEN